MSGTAASILEHLALVAHERARRAGDPALERAVTALKAYQQRRFRQTYTDLLASPRYAAAARFFLDELYGPHDFTRRDAEFARIVPALVRLFPQDVVDTVDVLAALHALSESLDSAMGLCALEQTGEEAPTWTAAQYLTAWQACGRASDREQQIALTLRVGQSLDRYTRAPLLRHSLKLMRAPAKAAGLSSLQQFLEGGFDTFAQMRGAQGFLDTIGQRERKLALALFGAVPRADESGASCWDAGLLVQLP